ncbi:helix-turn-helix domain-containing protein [[Clostridium] spiroforme]|nr:helix-turn-helix domain-containing protein [Thomasclavelia spiroformis]MBM6881064.1 helix-turn-helix domain-containing protein [Thomasclavelia spiroformis]MBM6931408.1 helix-turn-helix domain-containing protein [Thomasclavelia spiroformis]
MDKVSEYLKAARIAKGVTIDEIAEATLLSPSIIKDIEEGHFDRFSGDELYVKMYIRKIARYLEIDESIADDYYIKTREIKLAEIQNHEDKNENEAGSVTFVDKMSESLKNIQVTTTQKQPKGVYEDHYIKRYIKYAIIGLLVIAIIAVIGYSFVFTRSDDTSFNSNDNSTVEGTVDSKEDQEKDQEKEQTEKEETQEETTENVSTEIVFTRNGDGDFSFKLPEGYKEETFKLKVDFTFATTVDLHVNGDPNSYQSDTFKRGVYSSNLANISASDTLKEDAACESVELTFNVADFQYLEFTYSWNLGHRYYINDQKIPLEDNDHQGTRSNGLTRTFKLTMVK